MASGLPNKEKVRIRQLYAEGKVDRMALLESEAASYHAPGTCTFYGTANTNQMVVEFMGMQLPGSSFVHPDAPLREALTAAAARQVTRLTGNGNTWMPLGKMIDEKSRGERHCRAAGYRRLHQPHHASGCNGARGGHSDQLG